jgi:hypothetical protein
MHRSLLPSLVLLALTAVASPAAASTAGVQGATLSVAGASGERNRLTVAVAGDRIRVTDTGAAIRAGAGCTLSRRTVSCPLAGLAELVADLGDRNDRLGVSRGVTLRSRLRGGSGDDVLAGGGGPDELDGGTGRDAVTYAARADAVAVSIGGGADDGAPGEGDDVLAGVEHLVGTPGADVLAGSGLGERLEGRQGDDRLDGRGGNDTLVGGSGADALGGGDGRDVFLALTGPDGADVLQGGAGTDRADYGPRRGGVVADADGRADDGERPGGQLAATGPVPAIALLASAERDNVLPDVEDLRGGGADDVLAAGPAGGRVEGLGGTDVVGGGPGTDRLEGGAGFDRLLARDGRGDTLLCGAQADRAFADDRDTAVVDCEQGSRSFAVTLAPLARTLGGAGALGVRVSCPAQAAVRCVGAVRAVTVRRISRADGRRRAAVLGAARFNVPAGTAVDTTLTVDAAGRDVLRRLGGLTRVRLAARGRDEAGAARPAAARLVLRAG